MRALIKLYEENPVKAITLGAAVIRYFGITNMTVDEYRKEIRPPRDTGHTIRSARERSNIADRFLADESHSTRARRC